MSTSSVWRQSGWIALATALVCCAVPKTYGSEAESAVHTLQAKEPAGVSASVPAVSADDIDRREAVRRRPNVMRPSIDVVATEPERSQDEPAKARQASEQPLPLSEVGTSVPNPFELTSPSYLAPRDLREIARKVLATTFMVVPICILLIVVANRRKRTTPTVNGMSVVETIAVGPRCYCDLLSVRGKLFVLARDSTGIKGLKQVSQFDESLERFVVGEDNIEVSNVGTELGGEKTLGSFFDVNRSNEERSFG